MVLIWERRGKNSIAAIAFSYLTLVPFPFGNKSHLLDHSDSILNRLSRSHCPSIWAQWTAQWMDNVQSYEDQNTFL